MEGMGSTLGGRVTNKVASKVRGAAHATSYRLRQARYWPNLPQLSASHRAIVREIEDRGVATRALRELELASNDALFSVMHEVSRALDEATRDDLEYEVGFEHCTPLNPSDVASRFPEVYLWGLDEALLDLIETCVGLPIAYHGVIARRELVDGRGVGTRLWHKDADDVNIIRVSVYLNDVLDDDDGPFQYVPKKMTPPYREFRGAGAIRDELMARVVPESRWQKCLGPAGTVIFGAVAKVLHSGRVPKRPRKALSYYYTSTQPTQEELCRKFSFEKGLSSLRLEGPLSERQRSCLWKYAAYLPPIAG
jgi:hypothetical protein